MFRNVEGVKKNSFIAQQSKIQKKQSIETDPEMAQKIDLIDRGIKTAIINMLCMFKKIEESMNLLKKDKGKKDQH